MLCCVVVAYVYIVVNCGISGLFKLRGYVFEVEDGLCELCIADLESCYCVQ